MLFKLYEGSCGSHTGDKSLAHRVRSQSYWWPYMQKDDVEYVKKCDKCQKHASNIHLSATDLHPIISPWPFAMWGLDIISPFPRGSSNIKFLLARTYHFTKWVWAVPLVNIGELNLKTFL